MSVRARLLVFGAGAIAVGVLLIWSFTRLPAFGHYRGPYGDVVNGGVVAQRRVTEAVGAVTFDYRGIDTLGEELILLSCVVAVMVLLREQEDNETVTSPAGDDDEGRSGTA